LYFDDFEEINHYSNIVYNYKKYSNFLL